MRACRAGASIARIWWTGDIDGGPPGTGVLHEGVGTVVTRSWRDRCEATIDDVAAIVGLIALLEADGTFACGAARIVGNGDWPFFRAGARRCGAPGCAALHPFWKRDKAAEPASLGHRCRAPPGRLWRAVVVHYMEARACKTGLKRLFVPTTRTAHWFLERGFQAGLP
ncbi:MAG: hypothetical protein IPG33_02645 [Betaproteobacteria bacterium]|nr:hypothetical protein [Betaproteobacteria bacterium]